MFSLFVLIALLASLLSTAVIASPSQQTGGKAYTVQKDDWLSKLADKEYGDPYAWEAIYYYTNLMAKEDETYNFIANPNLIEIGWTLYIPSAEEAAAYMGGEVTEAVRGGTMTAGFDVGPGGFPERFDAWNATAGYYWFDMYLGKLVTYCDVTLTTKCGDLAESWDLSSDGKVYTFKLREDLTWHDGEPFTADDVKFTLDTVAAPGVSRFTAQLSTVEGYQDLQDGNATELAGVVVVDDYTVEITHTAPNAAFPDGLGFIYIMPRHAMADLPVEEIANNPWWQTNPVGIGPFKWVKYETGQYVELERFDNYWRGAPLLDRLINRYFPEPGTAVLALEAGEIDFTYVTADEMLRLKENPDIESPGSG